jgi:hypothetical protein
MRHLLIQRAGDVSGSGWHGPFFDNSGHIADYWPAYGMTRPLKDGAPVLPICSRPSTLSCGVTRGHWQKLLISHCLQSASHFRPVAQLKLSWLQLIGRRQNFPLRSWRPNTGLDGGVAERCGTGAQTSPISFGLPNAVVGRGDVTVHTEMFRNQLPGPAARSSPDSGPSAPGS